MKREPETLEPIEIERADQKFAYRVQRLASTLEKQAIRMLRPYGLAVVDWRILNNLCVYGPRSMTQMLPIAIVDQALISRRLKAMARNGLVEVRSNPEDGRQKILSASRAGRKLHSKIFPRSNARQTLMESALTKAEITTFLNVVEKLRQCVEDDLASGSSVSAQGTADAQRRRRAPKKKSDREVVQIKTNSKGGVAQARSH